MTDWSEKIEAFFHDPPSKPLRIPGHEEVSRKILDCWNLSWSEKAKTYDQIAAASDRPGVPGHEEGCSIDFSEKSEVTHPVSKERLKLKITDNIKPDAIIAKIVEIIDKFPPSKKDPDRSKFIYIWYGLRNDLSKDEPTLGPLWRKIPADTRIPDHSLWQHNSLVSALSNCEGNPYLFVFSLGPVQSFINEARKLRDLWVGSIFLSYLAWAGMRVIGEEYGPDHILYPSLVGQPLVKDWIKEKGWISIESENSDAEKIASFPNKFVALVPGNRVKEIAAKIEQAIKDEWKSIADSIKTKIIQKTGKGRSNFEHIWDRQIKNLWEFYWSASPWIKNLSNELADEISNEEREKLKKLIELFTKSSGYPENYGVLYPPSHGLVQRIFAATKSTRIFFDGSEEPGYKCTLCGKRDQLWAVSNTTEEIRKFWADLRVNYQDIGENERLCAVCMTKRLSYLALDRLPLSLSAIFRERVSFPSTTEMAFKPVLNKLRERNCYIIWKNYLEKCNAIDEAYQLLHDSDEGRKDDRVKQFYSEVKKIARISDVESMGKYYAILAMDGDKMGDLVNGKADNLATWRDIMHSDLPQKLKDSPAKERTKGWSKHEQLDEKRHLTPSVHHAISEALADFSLNTVLWVVEKYDGQLIYAGGDDLLAILPIDTVLQAAKEIRNFYRTSFLIKKDDGSIEECCGYYIPHPGETLLIHPGTASTISAAVVIAHHKEPLRNLIANANQLLKSESKEKCKRDAIAIILLKRSGGERICSGKWENNGEDLIDNLLALSGVLSDRNESSRLMYTIHNHIDTLDILGSKERVIKFIASRIEKGERDKDKYSGEGGNKTWLREKSKRAEAIFNVIKRNGEFQTDGLLIARFLAQGGN